MKSDTVTPDEVTAADSTPAPAVDLGKKTSAGQEPAGGADKADFGSRDAEPAGDDAGDAPRRRPGTRRGLLTPLLAVLAIASTIGVAVLGWQLKSANDIDAAGRAAQDAAELYAVALTSIDSQNLDGDFAAVLDGATGEFKDMYGQSSAQLKQLLIDNNATGTGTVVDSAIKSASADKAEILLFVDQTVTNSAAPEPRVDRSRVLMTMERVDGRWLAAEVALS